MGCIGGLEDRKGSEIATLGSSALLSDAQRIGRGAYKRPPEEAVGLSHVAASGKYAETFIAAE